MNIKKNGVMWQDCQTFMISVNHISMMSRTITKTMEKMWNFFLFQGKSVNSKSQSSSGTSSSV